MNYLENQRSSKRRPSGRALSIYQRAVIHNHSHKALAEEFGCSRQRIGRIVRVVQDWLDKYNHELEIPAVRAVHHSLLLKMYNRAMEEFDKSCETGVTTKVRKSVGRTAKVKTKVKDADGTETISETFQVLPEQNTLERVERQQCGDSRYLLAGDQLLKSIRSILGADAPKRTEISGPEGGPITLATMLKLVAENPPPIPELEEHPPNVIDVEAMLLEIQNQASAGQTSQPVSEAEYDQKYESEYSEAHPEPEDE